MNQRKIDFRMIIAILLAHGLLFTTFQERNVFWYILTASMLFLITFSILHEEMEDKQPFRIYYYLWFDFGCVFVCFISSR
jgi:uncharacterized protein